MPFEQSMRDQSVLRICTSVSCDVRLWEVQWCNVFADGKYLVLPSGELHIRDVGPEDGYKSYQCRTKHRLTGETRLSATKGRLVITGESTISVSYLQEHSAQNCNCIFPELRTANCIAQAVPSTCNTVRLI
jgi:hypothetical protein